MLKSYFTIAIRHLTRHKLFSLINMLCLAIGLTFAMLIGVYVLNEATVNSGIKNINSQYVIKSKWREENMGIDITTLGPLAKAAHDEYPALVANYYRFDPVVNIVSAGDKHFRTQISAGDTTLVSMFGFKLLQGDARQAFRDNQSAVVTESFAVKFFGKTDVLDKRITVQTPGDGSKHDFVITAVLKDFEKNSVANFTGQTYDVYLPMDANQYFQGDKGDNWANVFMASMLQLQPGVTPQQMDGAFVQLLNKYQPPFVKGNLQVQLAPMKNYYLLQNNGAVEKMLTTLSLTALFILVLAVINFINISIGTSTYRLKEIGLRKVFGSAKTQLILQYITESLVLTTVAALLSLGLYEALNPLFSRLLNTQLDHFWQFGIARFLLLALLVTLLGVVAGIYPAFVLSASNTINAVKGKIDAAKGGLILRKTLLVVQFTLAIVIFISALNVSKQVAYFFSKDVGYDKEQVMVISSLPRQWDSAGVVKMESLKSQLLQLPAVRAASLSYDIPDGNAGGYTTVYTANSNNTNNVMAIIADGDFASVFGIKMQEGFFLYSGSNFIPGKVVLNETAVKALGLKQPVTGKTLRLGAANGTLVTIAGVVKDFHLESIQKPVQPLVISGLNENYTRAYRFFSLKLNTTDLNGSIAALQAKWKTLFPDAGFEYSFMDDKFQSLYQSELQLKKAATIATALNLIIVLMGIFGVVAFTLTKRTREIAVRKILGAGVFNIISIFLREYGVLIVIANIIAWPIAYLATNQWLQGYAYRIQQNAVPYLFVCGFMFIAAFALIAVQCFKVATANPVGSLRAE